jgi:hypothetical protein
MFKAGRYLQICDVCGFKFHSDETRKRWDGLIVCFDDYEVDHPQKYLRVSPDGGPVPDPRPEPEDIFRLVCTIWTRTPAAEIGAADCATVDSIPTINPVEYVYPPIVFPPPVLIFLGTFNASDGTPMSSTHAIDYILPAAGVTEWDVNSGPGLHSGIMTGGELVPTDPSKTIRLEARDPGTYPFRLVPDFPVFLFLEGRCNIASGPAGESVVSAYLGGNGPWLEVTLYEGNVCYGSVRWAWYSTNYWNGVSPAAGTSTVKMGLWFDGTTAVLIANGTILETSPDLSAEGLVPGDYPELAVDILPSVNGDASELGLIGVRAYYAVTLAQAVQITSGGIPLPPASSLIYEADIYEPGIYE